MKDFSKFTIQMGLGSGSVRQVHECGRFTNQTRWEAGFFGDDSVIFGQHDNSQARVWAAGA